MAITDGKWTKSLDEIAKNRGAHRAARGTPRAFRHGLWLTGRDPINSNVKLDEKGIITAVINSPPPSLPLV